MPANGHPCLPAQDVCHLLAFVIEAEGSLLTFDILKSMQERTVANIRSWRVTVIGYGHVAPMLSVRRLPLTSRSSSSRHLVSLLPTICTSAAVFTVLSVGRAATAYSNLSERTCRSCRLPTMTF